MRAAVLLVAMAGVAHADVCSLDELPARIERLTGRAVDPSVYAVRGGESSVTVEIGDGSRIVSGESCDEALDAAALVIGMAAPEPRAVTPRVVAPIVELEASAPLLIAPPTAPREGWAVLAGVGVSNAGRVVTSVGARFRSGAASIGLELRVDDSDEIRVSYLASATIREAVGSAIACAHVSAIAACAVATAGVSHGAATNLHAYEASTLPLLAFGARLVWEYPQDGLFAIRIAAEVAARATTTHFDVNEMPIWNSRRFDGLATGAVVVRFP